MHISMDAGKCLACSILSLLGNFAAISSADCVLKFAMVKTVISCNLAVISSTQTLYGMAPSPRLHSGPLDPNISSVSS